MKKNNSLSMNLLNDKELKKISGGQISCSKTGDVITCICDGSRYFDVRLCKYIESSCSTSVTVDSDGTMHCEENTLISRDCIYPDKYQL